MLCKERTLKLGSVEIKTPILLPSISSRSVLGINLASFIEEIGPFYDGPLLVSAYDYDLLKESDMDFPSVLFLDSGGYECIDNCVCLDFKTVREHSKENWNRSRHASVLNLWNVNVPTVAISYDNPNETLEIKEQICLADLLFEKTNSSFKEILFKPGPNNKIISVNEIIENRDSFERYDVLGFTEKELGNSVEECMESIRQIRISMDDVGIDIPIHVFGNLDPVTTPLYFFAGADIFDGLSWLRFIFDDEELKYMDGSGSKMFGISKNRCEIFYRSVQHNLRYLRNLEQRMRGFAVSKDPSLFEKNRSFFEKTICSHERVA